MGEESCKAVPREITNDGQGSLDGAPPGGSWRGSRPEWPPPGPTGTSAPHIVFCVGQASQYSQYLRKDI